MGPLPSSPSLASLHWSGELACRACSWTKLKLLKFLEVFSADLKAHTF
jgi:hypothetical protein